MQEQSNHAVVRENQGCSKIRKPKLVVASEMEFGDVWGYHSRSRSRLGGRYLWAWHPLHRIRTRYHSRRTCSTPHIPRENERRLALRRIVGIASLRRRGRAESIVPHVEFFHEASKNHLVDVAV